MTVLRDGETETGIRKWTAEDLRLKARKSEAVRAL